MAQRPQPVSLPPRSFSQRKWPGTGSLVALMLLVLGLLAIATLAWMGGGLGALPGRTATILESAVTQAVLSTLFSALVAVPVAVTLNRRREWRSTRMIRFILAGAMVIPTTVAATGLLEIWGRNGIITLICTAIAGETACGGISIYGLHGVVLAHMFFNVPLLVWIFMPLLEAIPAGQWRIAEHLGLDARARFRLLEFPAIRQGLAGGMVLVFLLCFTSFALVLMLGGGPKVTTLEVEIYAAIRFAFDFKAAASLSLFQFGCAALVVAVMAALRRSGRITAVADSATLPRPPRWQASFLLNIWDGVVFTLIAWLIVLPMVMVVVGGLGGDMVKAVMRDGFVSVSLTSISVAITSAVLTLIIALNLAASRAAEAVRLAPSRWRLILLDAGVMLYLVIPSIVLGTAAFILLRHYGDAFRFAFGVVVMANTLLALPLATRLLEPRLVQIFLHHGRLAAALGIKGWRRWRLLTLPALNREIGQVLGLAAALSVGDLGVIALFASNDFRTLPWLLYQMAGSYRGDIAAALALILLALTLSLLMLGRISGKLFIWRGRTHA